MRFGMALFAIAGCAACGADENALAIAQVQEEVASELFDPSAAQFRDVIVTDGAVCGQVNGKNRLGGYVGFKPFFGLAAGEKTAGHIYDPADRMSEAVYGDLYRAHCDELGRPRSFEDRIKAMTG